MARSKAKDKTAKVRKYRSVFDLLAAYDANNPKHLSPKCAIFVEDGHVAVYPVGVDRQTYDGDMHFEMPLDKFLKQLAKISWPHTKARFQVGLP